MINPALLDFLRTLEQNNNKAWFDTHRAEYKKLRQEFVHFLEDAAERIAFVDPTVRDRLGDPKLVKVFRINRDLRFSKDKRPYKTNMGGTIGATDGEGRPLYYLSIEPGDSMAGGGIYRPPTSILHAIREKVSVEHETLRSIVTDPAFVAAFPNGLTQDGALKTAPRGYSVDHPAIEFLRLKSFAAIRSFSEEAILQADFEDRVFDTFEALSQLNAFLDSAR